MYLESLEIIGFKSFGKKTKFVFTNGITAIVGPNGCGKSNVVDAIRWVLGEQKAGLIRSERMENVIFNGSKTMRPLGMAEVSLTIHNTKNILPVEYSEVVITRRLFRSSESQYLINKSPCRLKDIQNLFMDTGMGPDAYSIIELSMVESILNGKADERRRIFEEAAGITKYKARRKAALRKLEATEADLLRLNDIIAEVEKNVNSLQRQVKKAQRYQELKEQLKEKELLLATQQFSRIHQELEPLIEKFKATQNKREELSTRFNEKEAEIEKARTQLLQIEKKLSAHQRELNELSLKIKDKEEEILIGRERRKALMERKERLLRQQEEIQQKLEKNQTQVLQTQEKLQELFQKIHQAEMDFQEKTAALKTMENRMQEKRAQLKSLEEKRVALLSGLAEQRKEEERIKTQLENLTGRFHTLEKELEENELLTKIKQDKLEKLQERKAELETNFHQTSKEHKKAEAELKLLSQRKDTLKEQILDLRSEIQTLGERIALLKKIIENYEDYPEGVQHLLREGYFNGECKGTLAEVLQVETPYRLAIETALGEAAVSLIVEATDHALKGIEVLRSKKKGTATFLPLEKFVSNGSSQVLEIDKILKSTSGTGLIGWAFNLVKCPEDFRPMVKSFLNDYLVVENLDSAKNYAEKLKNHRVNLVTLSGEVLSTWGPIKGGASLKDEAGIVGRKELLTELEKKLDKCQNGLKELENQSDQTEQKYLETFKRVQTLAESIKKLETQKTEIEVEIAQLNFEIIKEKENHERICKERDALLENEKQLKQQLSEVAPSLNDLNKDKFRFESEFDQISTELQELENQLNSQRAVTQDSRVKLVGIKSEEKHLQEEIVRLQDMERELNENKTKIEEELIAVTLEYTELEKKIESIKNQLNKDFEARQELEEKVHSIEHEYLQNKEQLEQQEKQVRELRIARDEVSEKLHEMELRVSELTMEKDRIQERMREEYEVKLKRAPIDESLNYEVLAEEISQLKNRIRAMEPVNLLALKEYEKEKSRLDFLTSQRNDLIEAETNLNQTIKVINKTARERFLKYFEMIRQNFVKVFTGFFEEGRADLKLAPNEDPLEADILIEADPKGRRLGPLTILSGGEKALTAISLLFAIYLVKPSPFCILDEVDAPLDDTNIGRFLKAIRTFSKNTQFIIITHNKITMREADCLYGITMEEEGVSKVVSVKLEDLELQK